MPKSLLRRYFIQKKRRRRAESADSEWTEAKKRRNDLITTLMKMFQRAERRSRQGSVIHYHPEESIQIGIETIGTSPSVVRGWSVSNNGCNRLSTGSWPALEAHPQAGRCSSNSSSSRRHMREMLIQVGTECLGICLIFLKQQIEGA